MAVTEPIVSSGSATFNRSRQARPKDFVTENLSMPVKDTEYGYGPLPNDCVGIEFKNQDEEKSRWSEEPGKVAAPTRPYNFLDKEISYYNFDMEWGGKTLYFASEKDNTFMELRIFLANKRS